MGHPLHGNQSWHIRNPIEKSDSANSYQGELLEMLAIHLFLYAITEFYGVTGSNNMMCDNKGAMYTFEQRSERIPAGTQNNGMQQVLWHVKSKMKSLSLLHHVKVHQNE